MHIQFWWAFSVLALGPDLLSRSSRSRYSLQQQRMNGLRIMSNCRSLMGFASTSPIAASTPLIDLAPRLFSAAGEVYAPPRRLGEVGEAMIFRGEVAFSIGDWRTAARPVDDRPICGRR